jgi:hypothetical protein
MAGGNKRRGVRLADSVRTEQNEPVHDPNSFRIVTPPQLMCNRRRGGRTFGEYLVDAR